MGDSFDASEVAQKMQRILTEPAHFIALALKNIQQQDEEIKTALKGFPSSREPGGALGILRTAQLEVSLQHTIWKAALPYYPCLFREKRLLSGKERRTDFTFYADPLRKKLLALCEMKSYRNFDFDALKIKDDVTRLREAKSLEVPRRFELVVGHYPVVRHQPDDDYVEYIFRRIEIDKSALIHAGDFQTLNNQGEEVRFFVLGFRVE